MAADFTVIIRGRKHFGNEEHWFDDVEPSVSFKGPTADYSFDCPDVDPSASAVLMFQTRDVDHNKNVFQINPATVSQPTIYGGIPVSPAKGAWNGNIMLIRAGALKETGNELHIESRNSIGGGGGDIDDFIIDNVVVLYKTKQNKVE